jgi:acetone carboxylase gamma subunit
VKDIFRSLPQIRELLIRSRQRALAGWCALYHHTGTWTCAHCDSVLTRAQNWRTGAVRAREQVIDERFDQLGIGVRARTDEPHVVLREYFCAACASALGVDVVTRGYALLPAHETDTEPASISE